MNVFTQKKFYPSLIISEEKIQVLELAKNGKTVAHLAEEKLEPHLIESGGVKDPAGLAETLKKLFHTANIKENKVVIGIPENKCYTKVLELPKLKEDELAEAVIWEADTYLPIDADQVYMDWKVVEEKGRGEYKILLIAVPKDIIEGYTLALQKAGLVPVALETTALSLVRLVEHLKTRALVAEIETAHAVFTLTKGTAIEASSTLNFTEEAEEGKPTHLAQTMEKMISFYETKWKDEEKVGKIYICGEGGEANLLSELKTALKRDVEFAPLPIDNLPKGKEQTFAAVASLAKKDVQAPRDMYTINLLPSAIQEEFDRERDKRSDRAFLVVSTIVLSLVTFAAAVALATLFAEVGKLEAQKQELALLPPEMGQIIQETQRLNKAVETITKAGQNRIFPQERLANFITQIPEGVNITLIAFNESQKKIQITGIARTRDDMLKFRDNIESQMYSNAVLPLSSLQEAENVNFVLTATME